MAGLAAARICSGLSVDCGTPALLRYFVLNYQKISHMLRQMLIYIMSDNIYCCDLISWWNATVIDE